MHRSLLVVEGPLRPGGPSRFTQLAIVRGHGAHALGDGGSERAAQERDRFVVDAVVGRPRIGTTGEAELHDRMDDDLAALRATLHRTLVDRPTWGGPALAAGLGLYWFYRGMMLEGSRWIALGFRHLGLARPVDAAILHSGLAALHIMERDLPAARPHLAALFEAADRATGEDLLFIGDEFAGLISPAVPVGDRGLLRELAARAAAVADRTGDANSALLARVAALRTWPRDDAMEQLAEAVAVHAVAVGTGNRWAGRMSADDAVRACLAVDDVDAALQWSGRGIEDYLALGAQDSPQFMELHGALHARRGDDVVAVRVLAGARMQNRRAAMRWPTRSETPAILAEAARRLGASAYERAWREGGGLRLADLAGAPGTPVAVPAPRPDRPAVLR